MRKTDQDGKVPRKQLKAKAPRKSGQTDGKKKKAQKRLGNARTPGDQMIPKKCGSPDPTVVFPTCCERSRTGLQNRSTLPECSHPGFTGGCRAVSRYAL